jgi:ABC-type antimicrobial peptide transport system permease subunit
MRVGKVWRVLTCVDGESSAYTSGTRGTMDEMVAFSDSVARDIGFNSGLKMTLPVAAALDPLKFLRIFLQQLFNSVVLVLVVHGCITIYALLLNDASARTYEYGMLRVLGMRKYSLGFLLMAQALYFSLPGVALGLITSSAISIPILVRSRSMSDDKAVLPAQS